MADVVASRDGRRVSVRSGRYKLEIDCDRGWADVFVESGLALFSFPTDVRVTFASGECSQIGIASSVVVDGGSIILSGGEARPWRGQTLRIDCADDDVIFGYSATAAERVRVAEAFYFLRDDAGMALGGMYEGFSPAPPHGRNGDMSLYSFTPAGTAYSYYSPSPLNVGLRFAGGWVGLGLMDLPNGDGISVEPDWSVKVDSPSGHLRADKGDTYLAPRLVMTFPADEWEGIAAYRRVLVTEGVVDDIPIEDRNLPDWWKRPIYCTYGDQIVEQQPYWMTDRHWDHPDYTSQWVRGAVEEAENRLGYREFTVVVDAFWMDRWNADPKPSSRFADLRDLVDWCHERGHKILLWYFPLHTSLEDGKGAVARRFGVLPPDNASDAASAPIDVTSPAFAGYAQYLSETLFGSGPGQFDADGLKVDFLFHLRRPASARYQQPEAGMGVRELHRWLEVFGAAARSVKPDVCINWSAADPHFEYLFGANRTHDTHFCPREFERRARISALASPNTPINFDGCLMRSEWVNMCYLPAALYGTPSLYYCRRFHGGIDMTPEQAGLLGKLFELSARRPWGRARFLSYGNWQLETRGTIVGETVDGKALIMFVEDGTGLVFSTDSGPFSLPLHGRRIESVEPEPIDLKIAGDRISAQWQRGVLYTLFTET